ncbi:DUF1990 family protein [Microbacterium sp. ZW T5_45]|uniref:DUF1990 family protein n=1 Tax=Microbacterium sp. ZW T5_45 TaxID=3378080 RepID=UPI00385205F8
MRSPAYSRGVTANPIADVPRGLRVDELSTAVPASARDAVGALIGSWELNRRVGFDTPSTPPVLGADGVLSRRVLGIRFDAPVRVFRADPHGLAYETRPGHPLYGEETFVVAEGRFTVRSISRPSTFLWWMLTPALRLMQRSVRRDYVRAVEAEIAAQQRAR